MRVSEGAVRILIAEDSLTQAEQLKSNLERRGYLVAELARTKDDLQSLNDRLEDLVAERTAALSAEIGERKQVEKQLRLQDMRLQLLLDLHDLEDAPQQQIVDFLKEAILKTVQSQFAFIGLVDDAESVATVAAGVWGECVRQRRPIVINDYDGLDPDKKKWYPAGHVPITRYLGIPVFDGDRIIAVAAAANKASDYTDGDVRAVVALANNAWVITGYGDLTRMKMSPDDPLRRNLETILDAAGRAAHLTRSLLSFSRKQIMERRPEDLNQLIKRVGKFLVRVIGEDVALTTRLPEREIPVLVDAPQIEQVLMNLVTNARDAMTGDGTLTITAERVSLDEGAATELGCGKPGAYALITVADTGVGMPEEVRRRIFEPFFTTKEVGKGTGLGLAVAYGIIQQHDGYITVQSEPGQGTTFKIFLPLFAAVATEEHPAHRTVEYQEGTETLRQKGLLAEGRPIIHKPAPADLLKKIRDVLDQGAA